MVSADTFEKYSQLLKEINCACAVSIGIGCILLCKKNKN